MVNEQILIFNEEYLVVFPISQIEIILSLLFLSLCLSEQQFFQSTQLPERNREIPKNIVLVKKKRLSIRKNKNSRLYVLEEVLVVNIEWMIRIESKREVVSRTSVRTESFERESE